MQREWLSRTAIKKQTASLSGNAQNTVSQSVAVALVYNVCSAELDMAGVLWFILGNMWMFDSKYAVYHREYMK